MLELVIDNFAGGGGASTGIEAALGRPIDYAINHDPEAIAIHKANHPHTTHYCQDVWSVVPSELADGRKIGLAWFSPDCKHFSKAKGGKPVEKGIRDLAWVVVGYAELPDHEKPRIIMLENVEEFRDWGPLIETEGGKMMPCPLSKGLEYRRWKRALEDAGYVVEDRELRACDYGAPTTRKRLFVIARSDGEPIVWPKPTHAPARVSPDGVVTKWARGHGLTLADMQKPFKPYRTAADIIDWSIPAPSIFERERPLVENTLRRVALGMKRYVIDCANPFIVPLTHGGDARVHLVPTLIQTGYGERPGQSPRVPGLEKPLGTAVDGQKHALVAAFLAQHNGENGGRVKHGRDPRDPLSTVTTSGHQQSVVAAFLAQHNTGMVGHDAREPVSTLVGKGCTQALVTSHLINMHGNTRRMSGIDEPTPTATAGGYHIAEVRAFLIKYFGTDQDPRLENPLDTITTKERFALVIVMIGGVPYVIIDIGMRMLTPRELFRAQGFRDSYIIDPVVTRRIRGKLISKPIPKSSQIRTCGNSVSPPVSEALVRANYVAPALPMAAEA